MRIDSSRIMGVTNDDISRQMTTFLKKGGHKGGPYIEFVVASKWL